MIAKPVALNNELHKEFKILPQFSLESVADRHLTPIMLQEFVSAAPHYPIFFLKNEEANQYNAVAVFGLVENQNLFIKDGKFEGQYVPANVRAYPFSLAQANDDQLVLCINEESDVVSKTEGQPLFDAEGKATEFFQGVNKFFQEFIDANNVSRNITAQLAELDLFKADGLQYRDAAGNERRVNGFFVIDREKFEALSDEQFLSLRKFGVLPAIYAHFSSLERIGAIIARLPA
jgi:hypothetical protein